MEAVPRLPMIGFDLKVSTEPVSFGPKLKQYIASFYHEDPESYSNEIYSLESLRSAAVRPSVDVSGLQMLKKYYCQLHFLKSRFPMEENQVCSVFFSWRDSYSKMTCSEPGIDFELMNVLYNIGALHTKLGALDSRVTSDGMKMACTHFQCAAWVFQTVRETFPQAVSLSLSSEVIHFMHVLSLAQAQECILEKSMLDNRKAAIIAKVAVQVVDYYKQSLTALQSGAEDVSLCELLGRSYRDWFKYLNLKIAYHKSISLLYQGEQSEEQQKMGERVAFYQAASEQLQEASKAARGMNNQQELQEALTFTNDVVEGKKKAAKNENEFIYHEEVPSKEVLQEVKGASLVKGIAFSINDTEVSGPDIFARLVPMEAHEAASLYSEQKAQLLRQIGDLVENKDRALAEFLSAMNLEVLTKMNTATGLTHDLVDRAAAMSAKHTAIQDLVDAMAKLSNTYHDVESMLCEIDAILKEEEKKEESYQSHMGSRPPSILATDLTREFNKYQEAHSKASDSNQNLHRAMTAHIANLKILSLSLVQLKQQIPAIELPNSQIDEGMINEMKALIAKIDEMRNQRAMLWNQFRDAVQNDDITTLLVTRQPETSLEQLFKQELQKHKKLTALIEQNMLAQENILKAMVDAYARFTPTRRFIQDVITKRANTISALTHSFDTYDDLLAKANKGFEFYNKLETNVSKLLQRIKSTAKVQDEEREQLLANINIKKSLPPASAGPKLKDYLEARKQDSATLTDPANILTYPQTVGVVPDQVWPPGVRPTPVGSEMNTDPQPSYPAEQNYSNNQAYIHYHQDQIPKGANSSNTMTTHSNNYNYPYMQNAVYPDKVVQDDLAYRMGALMSHKQPMESQEIQQPAQQVVPDQSYGRQTPQPQLDPILYYQQYTGLKKPEAVGQTYSTGNPTIDQQAGIYATGNQYSSGNPTINQQAGVYPTGNTPHSGTYNMGSAVVGNYSTGNQTVEPNSGAYSTANSAVGLPSGGYALGNPGMPQTGTYSSGNPSITSQTGVYSTGNPAVAGYSTNTSMKSQAANNYPSSSYAYDASSYAYTSTVTVPSQVYNAGSVGQAYGTENRSSFQYTGLNPTADVQTSQLYQVPNNAVPSSGTYINPTHISSTDGQASLHYQGPHNAVPSSGTYINPTAISSIDGQTSQLHQVPNNVVPSTGTYINQTAISGSLSEPTPASNTYPQASIPYQDSSTQYNQAVDYQQYPGQTETYNNPQIYQNTYYPYQQPTDSINYPNYSTRTSTSSQPLQTGYTNYPSQNVSTNQNVAPSQNTTSAHSSPQHAPKKEASNVDLLSGLDFTINQAPLIPQTKAEVKKEAAAQKPVEPVATTSVNQKSETKLNVLKVELFKRIERQYDRHSLKNSEIAKQFVSEVEKFEKYVDMLTTKTLNGPTTLDVKWKEIQDKQDLEQHKHSISVARCYPMKNRFADILPYDQTRIKLVSTKDDYINASYIKEITPNAPTFIITQSPLQSTFLDFWTMVWEQDIRLILCLITDDELGQDKYWPKSQGHPLSVGNLIISIQNITVREHWTDFTINVNDMQKRNARDMRLLQFTAWPGSLFPTSLSVINYINEVIKNENNIEEPILVHCLAGIGRTGLFCLLVSAMIEIMVNPKVLPDLQSILFKMTNSKKNVIRDREHLKFAYYTFLSFLKEICTNQIHKSKPVEDVPTVQSAGVSSTIDPLNMLDPLWATKK